MNLIAANRRNIWLTTRMQSRKRLSLDWVEMELWMQWLVDWLRSARFIRLIPRPLILSRVVRKLFEKMKHSSSVINIFPESTMPHNSTYEAEVHSTQIQVELEKPIVTKLYNSRRNRAPPNWRWLLLLNLLPVNRRQLHRQRLGRQAMRAARRKQRQRAVGNLLIPWNRMNRVGISDE